MSDSEKLGILLAVTDNQLAHQISQKIKAKFSTVPFAIDVVSDGQHALNQYHFKSYSVLILAANLPGVDGLALTREVRKVDGAANIFLLSAREQAPSNDYEVVNLPIVDWTQFLGRLQAAFPDELKAKHGLFERDSALYDRVYAYGRKYAQEQVAEVAVPVKPLLLFPNLFKDYAQSPATVHPEQGSGGVSGHLFAHALGAASSHDATAVANHEPVIKGKQLFKKHVLGFESVILLVLAVATGLLCYFRADTDAGWISLKNFAIAITAFSFFGYFFGRVFDRFVLSEK